MLEIMTSGATQSFPPHTLRRIMQAHHIVTDQAEQGTIEVPENFNPARQK